MGPPSRKNFNKLILFKKVRISRSRHPQNGKSPSREKRGQTALQHCTFTRHKLENSPYIFVQKGSF